MEEKELRTKKSSPERIKYASLLKCGMRLHDLYFLCARSAAGEEAGKESNEVPSTNPSRRLRTRMHNYYLPNIIWRKVKPTNYFY